MRKVLFEAQLGAGRAMRVIQGDLTEEPVDAIVNAANEHLRHGGGVAGAISRRGGPSIQQESDAWVRAHGVVPTGSAAITGAGHLRCHYVIHAVGPVWSGRGDEEDRLASAVHSALDLADQYELASVSMPGISSGIFGFPKPLCAQVMLREIDTWLCSHPESPVREVNACNIDALTAGIFCDAAARQFSE